MQKRLKVTLFMSVILLIAVSLYSVSGKNTSSKASNVNNVNLVLDSLNNNDSLPKNFRKTSDYTVLKGRKDINFNGLNKLNISGSQQFSGQNISLLIRALATKLPVTVVDLRQESHGFINGLPVSWTDSKNNANAGLTMEQVLKDEADRLKTIKLNEPITFYNHPEVTIVPTQVQDENELIKSKAVAYARIAVRDGGIPTDGMVDYFIEFVKAQPENTWLHFHCKHGIGRTSTFMIMYDMMKNYKKVSEDEIIKRQLGLANFDETTLKSFYNNERIGFLKSFYVYCSTHGDSFNIKWSEWKKASSLYEIPSDIKCSGNIDGSLTAAIETLYNHHSAAFVTGNLSIFKDDYDISQKPGMKAWEHEIRRVKYLNDWAAARGIKFTNVTSTVRIKKVSSEDKLLKIFLEETCKFKYIYPGK